MPGKTPVPPQKAHSMVCPFTSTFPFPEHTWHLERCDGIPKGSVPFPSQKAHVIAAILFTYSPFILETPDSIKQENICFLFSQSDPLLIISLHPWL